MSSYLFVRSKSSKTPHKESYATDEAAKAALAKFVADVQAAKPDDVVVSSGGGIAITKADFKSADVQPGYAAPIVGQAM